MGSDLPEWKLFLWLEQKKSNWDFVENWILLQLGSWKCLSLQDSFWTSLLVTHVLKYSVEPGPQSKQKHPHTSTDHPGTQTLSNLPPEKLALLRSSTSAAKTALPRSPSTAGVGGTDPCASLREHLRCWVFLWLQDTLPDATERFLDSCFISIIPARICRQLIPNQLHTATAMQRYT